MTATLFVHDAVRAHLAAVPARPYEVGGWLLGYWSEDETSVVITHATPPASRGTPYGVRISGRGHRRRFEQAWQASGGLVTFLGDWHTHPGGPPSPSERDQAAAQQLARSSLYGTPEPLVVIVSTPRWPRCNREVSIGFHIGAVDRSLEVVRALVTHNLPKEVSGVPTWRWSSCRGRRGRHSASL